MWPDLQATRWHRLVGFTRFPDSSTTVDGSSLKEVSVPCWNLSSEAAPWFLLFPSLSCLNLEAVCCALRKEGCKWLESLPGVKARELT